jgi:hypothetical protein
MLEKWTPLMARWLDVEPTGARKPFVFPELLDALRRHQQSTREERILRCRAHVEFNPTMDHIRSFPDWRPKLDAVLEDCSDAQIEYLSECGFWSFARLSTDTAPFRVRQP